MLRTLINTPWIIFTLPILAFALWISWLVVPPIIGTVVPAVLHAVFKALGE